MNNNTTWNYHTLNLYRISMTNIFSFEGKSLRSMNSYLNTYYTTIQMNKFTLNIPNIFLYEAPQCFVIDIVNINMRKAL